MNTDIRVSVSFKGHRKRRRLRLVLGDNATDYLLDLWISTAMNHPSGVLDGMDEIDIALDAGWEKDPQIFIDGLLSCGFLDRRPDGTYALHDWDDHQGYAIHANDRKAKAKKAAEKRWNAPCHAPSIKTDAPSNAPSMIFDAPSPDPDPSPTPPPQTAVLTEITPEPERHATRDPVNSVNGVSGGEEEKPEPREPCPSPPATREDETRKVDPERPSPEALIWPVRLAAEERQPMHDLLALTPPTLAQALLDELGANLQAGKVKTSPLGYLRGLLKRAHNGTFIPEAGRKIAQERERRRQSESALKAALERPPSTPEPMNREGRMRNVAEHIAGLYAALGRRPRTTEESPA